MEQTRIRDIIRNYVQTHIKIKDLKDEDNFYKLGFVNSLFALQLVMLMEKEFRITVENEDLDIENFNSIENMIKFVVSKRSQEILEG